MDVARAVELFGRRYPTPLLMAPIGVVGIMHDSQHGDLEVARAAATICASSTQNAIARVASTDRPRRPSPRDRRAMAPLRAAPPSR
ncbi:MAG: alpha-hydroxy-acid oxidizing protein, partial [Armatimonadota bacterium]